MVPQRVRRAGLAAVCALAVTLAGAASAWAQETGSVRGRIVDSATQLPLGGAQITIMGTPLGGTANQNGDVLVLNVPTGTHTVRVQMIGYSRQDVEVTVTSGQAAVVDVALRQSAIGLDELVVTGTAGQTEKRTVGNSVTSITVDDAVETAPISSAQELLTARAPGVTLTSNSGQAGASSKIRIRGASSLSASLEPVVYVDGIRVSSGTQNGYSTSGGLVQGTDGLDFINPDDIESIEVIKGPAAATLYGADAAAGVIQIITKKGRTGEGIEFTIQSERGTSEWGLEWPTAYTLCTTSADATALGHNFGNRIGSGTWPGCDGMDPNAPLSSRLLAEQPLRDQPNTFRTADIWSTSMSARGGTERFNFYLSGEKYNEQGIYYNNNEKRTAGRANFSFVPNDKLNFNVAVSYGRTNVRMPLANNASNGLLRNGMRYRPGRQGPWGIGWRGFTPELSNSYDNRNWGERTTLGLTVNYNPFSWFSNRLTMGMDKSDRTNEVFYRQDTTGQAPWGSVAATGAMYRFLPLTHLWTFDYSGTISNTLTTELASQFSAGMQVNSRQYESYDVSGEGLVANQLNLIGSAADTYASQGRSEQTSAGFFVQEMVGWRDRLFVTGAVRVDDNSAFGEDFSFVTYPKLSASYLISDEDFFNVPHVDELKLRAAFGQAGNSPPPFSADRTYSPDVTVVDGEIVNQLQASAYGNPKLKAETGSEIELGFDASMLEGRLGAELTYYNQHTLDALVDVPDPPSSGFTGSHMINVGEIANSGLEVLLSASPVLTRDIQWDATLSLATNHNELVDFGDEAITDISFGAFATVQKHIEGYPLGGFWAVDVERDANGQPILYDGAGNVTTDPLVGDVNVLLNDPYYVGPMLPTREIGLTNTLTLFRNLRLYTHFDYKGGNYQWCAICSINNRIDQNTIQVNDPNQDPVERLVWLSLQTRTHIMKADFIKLRELSLTYTLPTEWSQRFRASRASITLGGRNLWMWTKYGDGSQDPEVTFYSRSDFTQLDYASTPMTRRLTASVRLAF